LRNEEYDDLYFSPNGTGIIKVKRMSCLGHVACIAEMRNAYKLWSEKPHHTEDHSVEDNWTQKSYFLQNWMPLQKKKNFSNQHISLNCNKDACNDFI